MGGGARWIAAGVVTWALLGVTLAEEPPRPWAAGVTQENQTRAFALFKEGNSLFTNAQYTTANLKYREALILWAHPAIQFNLAVSLIQIDKAVEASEMLDSALRFGEAPLGRDLYQQGL